MDLFPEFISIPADFVITTFFDHINLRSKELLPYDSQPRLSHILIQRLLLLICPVNKLICSFLDICDFSVCCAFLNTRCPITLVLSLPNCF